MRGMAQILHTNLGHVLKHTTTITPSGILHNLLAKKKNLAEFAWTLSVGQYSELWFSGSVSAKEEQETG